MSESIILGITKLDPTDHVNVGRYDPHANVEDETAVLVVEIANARLLHTQIDGGHPAGRIAVFARLISSEEHQTRQQAAETDWPVYYKSLLKGTAK